jgi:hypothetical protein
VEIGDKIKDTLNGKTYRFEREENGKWVFYICAKHSGFNMIKTNIKLKPETLMSRLNSGQYERIEKKGD